MDTRTRVFKCVHTSFERWFRELGDAGASVAVIVTAGPSSTCGAGRAPAGLARARVLVTKPIAAFCVLSLVDRGALELDQPVAAHCTQFAQTLDTPAEIARRELGPRGQPEFGRGKTGGGRVWVGRP
jgi:hypothetical protein